MDSQQEDYYYQKGKEKKVSYQIKLEHTCFDNVINLDKLPHTVQTSLKNNTPYFRHSKDKSLRATQQLVLDPRTRLLLFKMVKKELLDKVNGCISTGKQANVYHAQKGTQEFAIKIFKTSILVFKDRNRYVDGEFRFRKGHCSHNPRKMVKLWAQKQFRNLKRIQGIIPCPTPILVKNNIILMNFIGKDMNAAPLLKQTNLDKQKYSHLYLQTILIMRTLFQQCHLIHGDLSQYNMLYNEQKQQLIIIDVSQSVQHEHPQALQFLKRDILNVNNYFRKQLVRVFNIRKIYQFVRNCNIGKGREQEYLEQFIEGEVQDQIGQNQDQDQKLFAQLPPKRTIQQMDLEQAYEVFLANDVKQKQDKDQSQSSLSSQESQSQQLECQDKSEVTKKVGGKQKYQGLSKIQRKHKVKQQKRIKRKEKMPKHIKKANQKKHKKR